MPDRIFIPPDESSSDVVKIGDACFERVGPSDQAPTVSSVDEEFDSCNECEGVCYKLANCVSDEEVLTDSDMSDEVSKVVLWGGDCWSVSTATCAGEMTVVEGYSRKSGCEDDECCSDVPSGLPSGDLPDGYEETYSLPDTFPSECFGSGGTTVKWEPLLGYWYFYDDLISPKRTITLTLNGNNYWALSFVCDIAGGDDSAIYHRACGDITGTYTKVGSAVHTWPDYVRVS